MIKEDERELFRELLKEPKGEAGGLFWRLALFERLGINEKRVDYILDKWSGRGIWDSGVTERTGWFTFTSDNYHPDLIRPEHVRWFLELSGGWLPPDTSPEGMIERISRHARFASPKIFVKITNPQPGDKEYAELVLKHCLLPDAEKYKPRPNMEILFNNLFRPHRPGFVDTSEVLNDTPFSTLDQLLAIPEVKRFSSAPGFVRFSKDGRSLMAEFNKEFLVVGFLMHPDLVNLPTWHYESSVEFG